MGVELENLVEDFENQVSKNLSRGKEETVEKSVEVTPEATETETTEVVEEEEKVVEEVTEEVAEEESTEEVTEAESEEETKEPEATEETEEVEKSLETLEEPEEPKEEPETEEESEKGLDEDKKDEDSEEKEETAEEVTEKSETEDAVEKSINDSVLGALEVVVKSYGQVSEETRGHGEKLTAIMDTLASLTERFTKLEGELTAQETVAKSLLVDETAKAEEPEEKAVSYVEKSATVAVEDVTEPETVEAIEDVTQDAETSVAKVNVKEINDKFVANVKKLSQEPNSRPKVFEMRQLHNRVHSGNASEEDYRKFLDFAESN